MDLGAMGEATLRHWAAEASITANRVQQDYEGWDFLLQFPQPPPETGTPLDLRPTRIECFVQVKARGARKSTGRRAPRESIELSNWEKLAKSPLPAFFLIIDYGATNQPKAAYLVHVGEQWIEKVMKRLRELTGPERERLNRATIDLTWSEANKLTSLDGKTLDAAMRSHIGPPFDAYIERKKYLCSSVGVEAQARVTITSAKYACPDDLMEDWVKFAIGAKQSVPVSKVAFEKDVRFGIPASYTEHEGGTISLDNQPKAPATLVISNAAGSRRSSFPASLYTAYYLLPPEHIPLDRDHIRVSSEIGDIVLRPFTDEKSITCTLKVPGDQTRRLDELANLWRVFTLLHNVHSEGCFIELSGPAGFRIKLDLHEDAALDEEVLSIAEAVDCAWSIAKRLDVPLDAKATVSELLGRARALRLLRDLSDVNPAPCLIRGPVPPSALATEKETVLVFPGVFHFGHMSLVVFVGFAGHPVPRATEPTHGGETECEIRDARIALLQRYHEATVTLELLRDLAARASAKLDAEKYNVIICGGLGRDAQPPGHASADMPLT